MGLRQNQLECFVFLDEKLGLGEKLGLRQNQGEFLEWKVGAWDKIKGNSLFFRMKSWGWRNGASDKVMGNSLFFRDEKLGYGEKLGIETKSRGILCFLGWKVAAWRKVGVSDKSKENSLFFRIKNLGLRQNQGEFVVLGRNLGLGEKLEFETKSSGILRLFYFYFLMKNWGLRQNQEELIVFLVRKYENWYKRRKKSSQIKTKETNKQTNKQTKQKKTKLNKAKQSKANQKLQSINQSINPSINQSPNKTNERNEWVK